MIATSIQASSKYASETQTQGSDNLIEVDRSPDVEQDPTNKRKADPVSQQNGQSLRKKAHSGADSGADSESGSGSEFESEDQEIRESADTVIIKQSSQTNFTSNGNSINKKTTHDIIDLDDEEYNYDNASDDSEVIVMEERQLPTPPTFKIPTSEENSGKPTIIEISEYHNSTEFKEKIIQTLDFQFSERSLVYQTIRKLYTTLSNNYKLIENDLLLLLPIHGQDYVPLSELEAAKDTLSKLICARELIIIPLFPKVQKSKAGNQQKTIYSSFVFVKEYLIGFSVSSISQEHSNLLACYNTLHHGDVFTSFGAYYPSKSATSDPFRRYLYLLNRMNNLRELNFYEPYDIDTLDRLKDVVPSLESLTTEETSTGLEFVQYIRQLCYKRRFNTKDSIPFQINNLQHRLTNDDDIKEYHDLAVMLSNPSNRRPDGLSDSNDESFITIDYANLIKTFKDQGYGLQSGILIDPFVTRDNEVVMTTYLAINDVLLNVTSMKFPMELDIDNTKKKELFEKWFKESTQQNIRISVSLYGGLQGIKNFLASKRANGKPEQHEQQDQIDEITGDQWHFNDVLLIMRMGLKK